MSDFVQFLALWAVTAGFAIAFGASVRLAFDAWEVRARLRRRPEVDFVWSGYDKARLSADRFGLCAMDAWTDPEPVTVPAGNVVEAVRVELREGVPVLCVDMYPARGPEDDAPSLGGDRANQ